jgi:hypothetical protein
MRSSFWYYLVLLGSLDLPERAVCEDFYLNDDFPSLRDEPKNP